MIDANDDGVIATISLAISPIHRLLLWTEPTLLHAHDADYDGFGDDAKPMIRSEWCAEVLVNRRFEWRFGHRY